MWKVNLKIYIVFIFTTNKNTLIQLRVLKRLKKSFKKYVRVLLARFLIKKKIRVIILL